MTFDYSRHWHTYQFNYHWEEVLEFVDLRNRLVGWMDGCWFLSSTFNSTDNFSQRNLFYERFYSPGLSHTANTHFVHIIKPLHKYHEMLFSYFVSGSVIMCWMHLLVNLTPSLLGGTTWHLEDEDPKALCDNWLALRLHTEEVQCLGFGPKCSTPLWKRWK